jgi:hypothetical protein
MKRFSIFGCVLAVGVVALVQSPEAPAQKKGGGGIPKEYRDNVNKGLKWLADTQQADGHWGSDQGSEQYKMAMTGLAGVALLMEGSTVKQGKYANHIRKAVDWCVARAEKNKDTGKEGLISDTDDPQERVRYMYGHGFATLFLACAYGDEADKKRQEHLKQVLTKACVYIGRAQSSLGGWYYTSKMDGGDQDEGSVTITQVQALRACKNAGIPVANEIIKKAQDYLKLSTTTQGGGVLYRAPKGGGPPAFGGERPALTAAAISCGFSAGDYNSDIVKQWFKFCKDKIGHGTNSTGHDDYTQYYWAQAVYILGDDGWEKLFGPTPPEQRLTWTSYRDSMFKFLAGNQNQDGSWNPRGGWGVGRVFATSINLTIMQLDRGVLPIHQR